VDVDHPPLQYSKSPTTVSWGGVFALKLFIYGLLRFGVFHKLFILRGSGRFRPQGFGVFLGSYAVLCILVICYGVGVFVEKTFIFFLLFSCKLVMLPSVVTDYSG